MVLLQIDGTRSGFNYNYSTVPGLTAGNSPGCFMDKWNYISFLFFLSLFLFVDLGFGVSDAILVTC